MKIDKFWLVTKPKTNSILTDILSECDYETLYHLHLAGLKPEEIFGFYTTKEEAEHDANGLLKSDLMKELEKI